MGDPNATCRVSTLVGNSRVRRGAERRYLHMTKNLWALCIGLMMACGSSHPNTKNVETGSGSAACAPTDCGAEPPIAPSACPHGAAISSECRRATSGGCERKVLCDGKDANDTAQP
jgi:hypothetical protein